MSIREHAGAATLEVLGSSKRYNQWIFDRIRPALGERLLEVGCGTGTMTQFMTDRELVVGVDVHPDYVESTQQRFKDKPNVVIRLLDITTTIEPIEHYRFDSAVSINVLEHIPDDEGALKAVHHLLVPGGRLTLFVPCHPILMSPFDEAIGHYRRYTKRDLAAKLRQAGVTVERMRRTNPVGAFGWLVTNTLLRNRSLRGAGLYDRLVPLLRRIDELAEPPVGLSIIAVGRKA